MARLPLLAYFIPPQIWFDYSYHMSLVILYQQNVKAIQFFLLHERVVPLDWSISLSGNFKTTSSKNILTISGSN